MSGSLTVLEKCDRLANGLQQGRGLGGASAFAHAGSRTDSFVENTELAGCNMR